MDSTHPLVLGLFTTESAAASAARALRDLGLPRQRVSIVARTHLVEGTLAAASGASPGTELEDSATAAKAGELSGYVLAAMAMVLPGIGPIVAGGPLAADLSETAGHLAGSIAKALTSAGIEGRQADLWEEQVGNGAVIVGAHVGNDQATSALDTLRRHGASEVVSGTWAGELP